MSNRHYSSLIDPATGDYVLEKGSTVRDETLQFPAYARLKIQREKWLYAPDENYGSDIGLVVKQTRDSGQALENAAARALQPLIDDERANDITVAQTGSVRFACELDVLITDLDGDTQSLTLNPVGI